MGATHAVNPEIASADPSVAYEGQIAGDLVRRVLIVSPAVLLVAGLVRGVDGLDQRGHRAGARRRSTSSRPPPSSPTPPGARPVR